APVGGPVVIPLQDEGERYYTRKSSRYSKPAQAGTKATKPIKKAYDSFMNSDSDDETPEEQDESTVTIKGDWSGLKVSGKSNPHPHVYSGHMSQSASFSKFDF